MRQDLGLGGSNGWELIAQYLCHNPVQRLAPALEQILVSSVLDQRVLEAIFGFRR